MIASLTFSGIVILYLVGWAAHLHHFHSKFKECHAGWVIAKDSGDYAEQRTYQRATRLAHEDTGMAMFWPVVINRWNADYVAEARSSQ